MAVATAVIEDTLVPPEHATRDLVMKIHRGADDIVTRQTRRASFISRTTN
jgi:hypothetical protein